MGGARRVRHGDDVTTGRERKPSVARTLGRNEAGEQSPGKAAAAGQRKVQVAGARCILERGNRIRTGREPEQRVVLAVEQGNDTGPHKF